MNKCFDSYEKEYQALPFERHQATLRRRELLRVIHSLAPKRIVEIGSGIRPLFCDLDNFEQMTVVEAADSFAKIAIELARDHLGASKIEVFNALLEDLPAQSAGYDLTVIAGLLHEVPNVPLFLEQAAALGGPDSDYLIVVPNANSFHRQFALRDGLIDDLCEISEQQQVLQQFRTYNLDTLDAELASVGFKIKQSKSIIFKPFTHQQMERLLEAEILTEAQIYTLCEMVDLSPDYGSELLVIASYEG